MPIKINGQNCKVYKGDHKPVNLYRGEDKVAGWVDETQTGTGPLTFTDTYNDEAEVNVEGNSVQDGTPSPNYPSEVNSVEGADLVSKNADGSQSAAITLPTLRKIGDVADTYNPKTGEYVQRIQKFIFTGSSGGLYGFGIYIKKDKVIRFSHYLEGFGYTLALKNSECFCSHLKNNLSSWYLDEETIFIHNDTGTHFYTSWDKILLGILDYDTDVQIKEKLRQYLADQYAAGTPVTVYYQLATSITTYLDPATVPTYPKTTVIEQDAEVKGTIEATVKVIDTELND